ncbi:exopolysaccharide biosynthesis protein [Hoeflea prorocentri]|uniref:Exopolysaccharide biosynthesis protein n=1 Tax=Hoeflea prorocentri TaxID=1922333 RepID=A0A9X3UIZ6_9HYPH|nr:exopolysaccharide biosynthesis protein [Hoeflea prorocentri]MCY6380044.1 exopolysaccharide biosynthesis protein [Hoeflea prorocentri]MDA5397844.1 exopolysaccharide biosynthesis protein [Hoeflea prorocentri]
MSDRSAKGSVSVISVDDHKHTESLSALLNRLADEAGPRVTLRQLAEALDERSFGAFLLVFSIPNLIPLPPGATLVLGLPLIVIAWQIVAGRNKIWLPERLANYSLEKKTLQKIVKRCDPWLKWMEAWVRPRHWPLRSDLTERLFGLYILFLAFIVVVPIPFGNWLPAFAIATIGLAHTEQDGNCLAVGSIIGIIATLLFSFVLFLTTAIFNSVV